jgi:hypothetical protein
MKEKSQISKDDVARLIHGKRSRNRVGSRQIRHRLRQDELERLEKARDRGYLLITPSTRTALKNAWYLDCQANSRPFVSVERASGGFLVTATVGEQSGSAIVEDPDSWRDALSSGLKTERSSS